MLVRSWNLFHGNAVPPDRHDHLEEMVRLLTEDRPDVVCLQEVPVWALGRLADWSSMQAVADAAQRPRLGPLPIPAELGRRVTALNHGLFRSAFTGQGNAILVSPGLRVAYHHVLALNPPAFRAREARRLGLDPLERLAWARERRVCQIVRLAQHEAPTLVVANLHATNVPVLAEAEVVRAAAAVDAVAEPGEPVILAGDFNLRPALDDWGYEVRSEGIDHILTRRLDTSPPTVWPPGRRRRGGVLLSDHAPVEVTVT